MFNKTIVVRGKDPVPYCREVHEHRAPTDESIRIYKEMEDKAFDHLLSITKLDNNEFKATWHVFYEGITAHRKAVVRFMLNGKEHTTTISICDFEAHSGVSDFIVEKVREAMTRKMAEILTLDLVKQGREFFRK